MYFSKSSYNYLNTSGKYYPYGMLLPNRHGSAGDQYEYGFNGMRKDDEIKNQAGTSYDFGARMYDPRVGRWLTIDPLAGSYASLNPYNFANNNPILLKDPDGEKIIIYYDSGKKDENNQPILEPYNYKSGLRPPKDKFVRATVRTLKRIERRGADRFNMIEFYTESNDKNIEIIQNPTALNKVSIVSNRISWHQNSGALTKDGVTMSAARNLLHEIGHAYYEEILPTEEAKEAKRLGTIGMQINIPLDEDPRVFYEKIAEFEKQEKLEMGDLDTYEEKWIIEEVEPTFNEKFKEKDRSTHKGSEMETRRPFSTKEKKK